MAVLAMDCILRLLFSLALCFYLDRIRLSKALLSEADKVCHTDFNL